MSDQYKAFDQKVEEATKRMKAACKGSQFVKGVSTDIGYRVGRYVTVKTERKPRILDWVVIKLD
tara:strand:+ start:154 stop:345 length:192 start_codon:yes stop_codon:yes gene_type:complete